MRADNSKKAYFSEKKSNSLRDKMPVGQNAAVKRPLVIMPWSQGHCQNTSGYNAAGDIMPDRLVELRR